MYLSMLKTMRKSELGGQTDFKVLYLIEIFEIFIYTRRTLPAYTDL